MSNALQQSPKKIENNNLFSIFFGGYCNAFDVLSESGSDCVICFIKVNEIIIIMICNIMTIGSRVTLSGVLGQTGSFPGYLKLCACVYKTVFVLNH